MLTFGDLVGYIAAKFSVCGPINFCVVCFEFDGWCLSLCLVFVDIKWAHTNFGDYIALDLANVHVLTIPSSSSCKSALKLMSDVCSPWFVLVYILYIKSDVCLLYLKEYGKLRLGLTVISSNAYGKILHSSGDYFLFW